MKKRIVVISLGGSLIVPKEVDYLFLEKFKRAILKNSGKFKFIVVCGGGSVARKYIYALKKSGMNETFQSYAGISATRMNARFMSYFFHKDQHVGIPHSMTDLKNYLKKYDIVFCGALEYKPHQTSDSTSAQIANEFNSPFINLTDVPGLYSKNPKKHKDARFIDSIGWKDFHRMANATKFEPGQHFVLDQKASEIIMKKSIPTYILGKDMQQLENLLHGRKFKGTTIIG